MMKHTNKFYLKLQLWITVPLLFLLSFTFSTGYLRQDIKSYYWDKSQHKPVFALQQLLKLENLEEPSSWQELVEITQKKWLRAANAERWNLKNSDYHNQHLEQYINFFTQLELICGVSPHHKIYHDVLILGGTSKTFVNRIEYYLSREKDLSLQANCITLLPGERTLEEEEKEYLKNTFHCTDIQNETQLVNFLKEKFFKNRPEVRILHAKKKEGASRATTEDNFEAWIQNTLQKNMQYAVRTLIVTNQPYGFYQLSTGMHICKNYEDRIQWDLAAAPIEQPSQIKIPIYLDSLTRTFYAISK